MAFRRKSPNASREQMFAATSAALEAVYRVSQKIDQQYGTKITEHFLWNFLSKNFTVLP